MAGEWPTVPVSAVATAVIGGTPSRSVPDYWNGSIPWATARDVAAVTGRYLDRTEEFITNDGLRNSAAKLFPRGTVVITARGTVGALAQLGREMAFNQTCYAIIPKTAVADKDFLFYALKATIGWMRTLRYGTVFDTITTQTFDHWLIPLPPLPEQHAIAHILGTLDDKIELNRRMSETLEQMVRAIFKAWFIDFEPVRAKMEGRWQRGQSLPGLPAHLYDLFPDRLVASELGEIPEGWKATRLGNVLRELVSGGRPKGGAVDEGVPSIGAENIIGLGKYDFSKEKYIPREFFEELQRKGAAVRPGDVLLSKDGSIGRKTYFDCGFPHAECAVNEHVFIVRAQRPCQQGYLFFWLDQDWMTQEIISLNSNSAQPGINQQGVRSLPLLMAPDAVVEAFDQVVRPLTDRLFTACLESRTLAALRDALLPKLIRGEIRVKDAERFLKERGL